MKMVLDENIHRSLGDVIQKLGHEILDIRDHGLRGKPDEVVFNFAQKHEAALISEDMGFASIIRFPLGSHHGIIILRFPNQMSTETINEKVYAAFQKIAPIDMRGNLIIIAPENIRMRRKIVPEF